MSEHKQKYDELQKHYTEVYRYFEKLLGNRPGILNRPYSRYHGRKVIVNPSPLDTWISLATHLNDISYYKDIVDLTVRIGIERKDGRDGFIWDHAESHARLSEIEFDEPLP